MQIQRLSLFSLFLSSCATADRVEALEARVAELEAKASAPPAPGGGKGGKTPAPPDGEDARLYEEAGALVAKGDYPGAIAKLEQMMRDFPESRLKSRADKTYKELIVIGKPAPPELKVEKWFQGEGTSLTGGEATLIVFWEEWCPHCKREVPELVKTYDQYKGQGLQVVGLTKINRKATEEGVQAFITEHGINYPIAKETGEMSEYFNVSGVPAAAVVKDGQVVWRGHPGRITPEMITGWLGS